MDLNEPFTTYSEFDWNQPEQRYERNINPEQFAFGSYNPSRNRRGQWSRIDQFRSLQNIW